jgi:hypothetical protein
VGISAVGHKGLFYMIQNPYVFINTSILVVPIDELQEGQIGFKLSILSSPPLASAIICPQ